MHCALRRTCSNAQKIEHWENNHMLKSLEESNFREPSKLDSEVSSHTHRNFNHRCAISPFFALEPDGHWRIIPLPSQCPDHTIHLGSITQVKMDGLHLVSPSLVSPVRVSQQKTRRGPTTERNCSVKEFSARSFSGSKYQYQSRNKVVGKKLGKWNALPGNSCQTSFKSSDSSIITTSGSAATNSSNICVDVSKVAQSVKGNTRKKGRKKGKRNKKPSHDTGSSDLECVDRSSTSEYGICNNPDCRTRPLVSATMLAVPSPECSGSGNDSEGNSSSTISCFETPKRCTSYIHQVGVLAANFVAENPISNAESELQTVSPDLPVLSSVQGIHSQSSQSLNGFKDPPSSVFPEAKESCLLDSVSVCSNGCERLNAGYHVILSNKVGGGTNLSEHNAKNGHFPYENMLKSIADSSCYDQGTTSCAQVSNNSEMGRRGKQIKSIPRNPSVPRLSNIAKFYGRSGKENNHSIWQKVERSDTDACSYGFRNVNSSDSQSGIGFKEVKKNLSVDQSSISSTGEDKIQSKVKASRKLKRRPSPGSKKESSRYHRKGSVCMKISKQQNEVLDIPAQLRRQKGSDHVSRSRSKIGCPQIGFQTNRVESITSEPVHSLEVCPIELEPLQHICSTLSNSNDPTTKRESSLLSGFSNDKTELLEQQPKELLQPPGAESNKVDKDVSSLEHSKQDYTAGPISQKWIPVGVKSSEHARSSHFNSLKLANLNKPAAESCIFENFMARETVSVPNTCPSSVNVSLLCTIRGPLDDSGLHSEDEVEVGKCRNENTSTRKEPCNIYATAKCLNRDPKGHNIPVLENGSNKIAEAVNDAYRAQLASEAVQVASGFPIAEFERLLYSASPVISPPRKILSCQIYSPDEVGGVPLCRHETPSISLGSLWEWYEKHGTYGLEVRAEEYENSKRLGIDQFAFRAYFVPFLSAVQLFRVRNRHPSDSGGTIPGTEAVETCKLDRRSGNSSNINCLPVFSVLVPRPHIEDTSSVSPKTHVCCSDTASLCIESNGSINSDDSTSYDDLELLFEYFEVEQPQQRRPLFEKVKELVRGDAPSKCRSYGDPTLLDSVDLNDLHPKSWFSVAWYPIYRIPDGNFRAAFLTYHSLGHLVHRRSTPDSFATSACVVSPVVGLQSYNAQSECWFQPRQSQTTDIQNLNPSATLKERLRTLEHTASLMARAVVAKGKATSVNRQPDYEFFLSRRRW